MNASFFNKQKEGRLFLIFLLFSLSQIACEEGRTAISDFNPDVTVSNELYALLGNTLYALKDNRIPEQDFSKNSQIDPFWTAQIPGNLSVSTPLLIAEGSSQENKIYVSSADGKVYKYSDSGDLEWQYEIGGEITASVHTALVGESSGTYIPLIYIGNKSGKFVCLDGADGTLKWESEIPNGAGIESTAQHVNSNGNDYIIFGSNDGFINAHDPVNGEKLWSFNTGASIKSKGKVINGGQNFVVGNIDGDVFNMEVGSGNVVWSRKLPGPVFSTPETILSGGLAIGCSDGNMYSLSFDSGEILWQFQTGGAIYSSPFSKNIFEESNDNSAIIPMLFFSSFDEHLYSLNSKTGSLIWKKDLEAGQLAASPVAFAGGGVNSTVYMNTSRGLISVSARTGEYQSIFNSQTEGNFTSSVMPYIVLREGIAPVGFPVYPNNLY